MERLVPPHLKICPWLRLTTLQFVFFAVFCLLSFIWTFYFVPETSGRTLEAMDHVFKDNNNEAENTRRDTIERSLIADSQSQQQGVDGSKP